MDAANHENNFVNSYCNFPLPFRPYDLSPNIIRIIQIGYAVIDLEEIASGSGSYEGCG